MKTKHPYAPPTTEVLFFTLETHLLETSPRNPYEKDNTNPFGG